MTFTRSLEQAALASTVTLAPEVVRACAAHFDLVVKWNRTHNLTRVTEPAEAARRHYLDVLVPGLALVREGTVVDMGSGAGFPGLLLAIVWPRARFTLVEPARKRASFLELAAAELGVRDRVEVSSAPGKAARSVVSRATFPVGARLPLAEACAMDGEVLLWGVLSEAADWAAEAARWGLKAREPHAYQVDGLVDHAILCARR